MIAQPINQDLLKRFGRFPSSSFKDSCSDTCEEVEHFPEVIRANRGKTVGATQAQDLLPQIAAADLGAGSGSTDSGACGLTSPEKEARAADLASTTQACLTQGIEP
ncbi:unnamed protein product [Durusdinium trenchii]|uniref:Uncharacterized protein n=1 Tax=Durusdinium trenchii TaxID=1381693 RepID=A0ABP0QGD0_9DINO